MGKSCASLLLALATICTLNGQLAAGKPKFVGNVIDNIVHPSFTTYWNQVTPGNAGKWGSVESQRDVMNWAKLDEIYAFAAQHNLPFKEHTLVWGNQEPPWISSLSAADQLAEVEEWFQAFAARYPNTAFIDVVNEPLHVIPSYANALGGSGSTGWDWVIWSFEKARQYNPNAKLLLNDYGILGSGKATSDYLKIINLLKARGLIDGIGVQGHGLEYAQSGTIQRNLDSLAATGIPIYVTELDLEHESDTTQLDMYKRVFPLLYEHPGVAGVTLWGYLAGDIWKANAYLLGKIEPLAQWTLTTSFQDYSASAAGGAKIQVHFTNDDVNNSYDAEVDHALYDGIVHQAEEMPKNTGVWTGVCGGSYSQWLHCNGFIEFPTMVASGLAVVRARGVTGNETMQLKRVNDTVERLALQWLRYEYFAAGGGGGGGGGGVLAEAENGALGGVFAANTRPGFSGNGYVTGFNATGEYVEVVINLVQGGSFPLAIGYAADNSIARSIRVNGSVVKKNLSFPASSAFTEVEVGFNVSFLAGPNTIRVFMERGSSSGGDIDYIRIPGAQ